MAQQARGHSDGGREGDSFLPRGNRALRERQQQLTNCSVQRKISVQRPVQQPMVKAPRPLPPCPPCSPSSSRSPHPDRPRCLPPCQPAGRPLASCARHQPLPFVRGSPSQPRREREEGRRVKRRQAGRRAKPPPPTRLRPWAWGGLGRRVGVWRGGREGGRAARAPRL